MLIVHKHNHEHCRPARRATIVKYNSCSFQLGYYASCSDIKEAPFTNHLIIFALIGYKIYFCLDTGKSYQHSVSCWSYWQCWPS